MLALTGVQGRMARFPFNHDAKRNYHFGMHGSAGREQAGVSLHVDAQPQVAAGPTGKEEIQSFSEAPYPAPRDPQVSGAPRRGCWARAHVKTAAKARGSCATATIGASWKRRASLSRRSRRRRKLTFFPAPALGESVEHGRKKRTARPLGAQASRLHQ